MARKSKPSDEKRLGKEIQCSHATRDWLFRLMAERNVHKQDFIDRFQWPPHYFDRLFTQRSYWTTSDVAAFCNLLHIRPEVLMHRLGTPVERVTVPIIGTIKNGVVRFAKGLGHGEMPPDTPGELAALRSDTEGPWRSATFYYARAETVLPTALGRLAYVETEQDSTPLIGMLSPLSTQGTATVVIVSTGKTFKDRRLVAATPILWVRAG